jgi:hypothetical protein
MKTYRYSAMNTSEMLTIKHYLFASWENSGISRVKNIWDQGGKCWKEENIILQTLISKHNWG